mmetsp:Transcript_35353/g.91939  ORF Transcript_35353/g.91939 Transcript_35353/m.91939 type:complete len:96 (-) Transcript_35353:50-337(-)
MTVRKKHNENKQKTEASELQSTQHDLVPSSKLRALSGEMVRGVQMYFSKNKEQEAEGRGAAACRRVSTLKVNLINVNFVGQLNTREEKLKSLPPI